MYLYLSKEYIHIYTSKGLKAVTGRLDQLAAWEQDIRDELATISKDLETLISRRDHLQAKLDLVRVLLNLERGPESEDAPDDARAHTRQTTAERICEAVAAILDEGGEPMHIGSIRAVMLTRGISLPGRGTDANIIVHLTRRPDLFVRIARGTYGLAKWNRPETGETS